MTDLGAVDAPSPMSPAPREVSCSRLNRPKFAPPTLRGSSRLLRKADGRLLARAFSDSQGRFTLHLPANSPVMLQTTGWQASNVTRARR